MITVQQDVRGRSKTTSFAPAAAWKGLAFGSPCSPKANMGNQKKAKGARCRRRNLECDERLCVLFSLNVHYRTACYREQYPYRSTLNRNRFLEYNVNYTNYTVGHPPSIFVCGSVTETLSLVPHVRRTRTWGTKRLETLWPAIILYVGLVSCHRDWQSLSRQREPETT